MVSLPFILFWSVGMILQIQVDYLIKLGLFVVIYVYTNVVSEFVFDDRLFRYFFYKYFSKYQTRLISNWLFLEFSPHLVRKFLKFVLAQNSRILNFFVNFKFKISRK